MNSIILNRIEQIKKGEVPMGYKITDVGITPIDWNTNKFTEFFQRQNERNIERNSNILSISAQQGFVKQGHFFTKEVASEDKSNYYILTKDDFAYNKSYSKGYPMGAIKRLKEFEKGIVSPIYICFRGKEGANIDFYEKYFEAGRLNRQINNFAQEGARDHGLLNLSINDFINTEVVVPEYLEQRKIVEVLLTWDMAVDVQNRYIIALEKKKNALMQKLLQPKSQWQKIKLGNVIKEVTTRNSDGKLRAVSSISNTKGFIPQSEQFDKEVASKDTCNYKVISKGCFAYNPSRINVGSLAFYDKDDEVIVSPMYIVFKSNEAILLSVFLNYWLQTYFFSGQMKAFLSGSVRDSLNFKDLSLFKFALPTVEEQKEIATILSMADAEISMEKAKLELYKLQKKSLMQLLLTGIVRVNNNEDSIDRIIEIYNTNISSLPDCKPDRMQFLVMRQDNYRFEVHSNENCGHNRPHVHVMVNNSIKFVVFIDKEISSEFSTTKYVKEAIKICHENIDIMRKGWNDHTNGIKITI